MKWQEAKGPQRQNPNPSKQTGREHQRADAGVEAGSDGEKTGLREGTVGQEAGARGAGHHTTGKSGLTAEIQWLCPTVPQVPGHQWSHRLLTTVPEVGREWFL